jgi:hypothetical protein
MNPAALLHARKRLLRAFNLEKLQAISKMPNCSHTNFMVDYIADNWTQFEAVVSEEMKTLMIQIKENGNAN